MTESGAAAQVTEYKQVNGPRAWTAASVDDPVDWVTNLTEFSLLELESFVAETEAERVTETRIDPRTMPSCTRQATPLRQQIESGRGFVLIDGLDEARFGRAGSVTAYWALGQLLGAPFAQNVEGTLLYDVRDTGQSVTGGARFSVTNAESTFHTDNAFNPALPDVIGLLCQRTAKSGGRSQLISGCSVHDQLCDLSADMATLYGEFLFDRRSQHGPDELPYAPHHLFAFDGDELVMRYMAYYIEVGHEKAGTPLTDAQIAALSALESQLKRQDLMVEFDLLPGQMMFTNNRWILHNRTAFEDHSTMEDRRHYVRLWLSR